MRTKLHTALISILSIALLAWFLRGTNLGEVWNHVRAARVDLLFIALVFVALTYWARTIRWQYLLAPLGHTSFRNTFRATVIGFAALSILPARAGDLVRPYLLARREGLSVPATFATVVLERVLDLVAVLALLAVYVWGFDGAAAIPPYFRQTIEVSAALAAAAVVILMAVMWTLASHPERIGRIVLAAARILPSPLALRLSDIARTFSGGFAVARAPRELALATLWSLPLWLALAAEAWAVTRAFGIDMSFPGSFLLQGFLVIGVAVPTPGAVGGYHAMYRFGVTTFFGASNESAVAAAIVVHAISFVPIVLVGIVFMAQDGLSVGQLRELAGEARQEEMPQSNAASSHLSE